jgi:hypothetical protein
MKQKLIVIPFDGGYAKLLFNKVDGQWECIMTDEYMHLLASYLKGEEPREWVTPVDLGDFDH